MILSKIKKHFSIAVVRLKQKEELKKILLEKNDTLTKIVQAFLQVQSKKFTNEEISIFRKCETYRQSLLDDETLVSYDIFDFNKKTPIKAICKQATSESVWAQFLFLITKKINSPYFLEIGTNLGVSGSYILEALKNKMDSKFVTMEGLPQLCDIASKQFESIANNDKYEIRRGLYKSTFPKIIEELVKFNIVFIDGNHKKGPTLKYFSELKLTILAPVIIIFDDINWSDEMREVWKIIKTDLDVHYSIDFFKLGIVIIDEFQSKNQLHFKLHLTY